MRSARRLFDNIQDAFPGLAMKIGHNAKSGGVTLTIPVQPGLTIPVLLDLQHDDFLMKVRLYQLEWIGVSYGKTKDAYVKAVCGMLSGRLRVLEHYRGGRAFKAELQEPDGEGWKTVEMLFSLHVPLP